MTLKTLPEAQRTQGIESITWVIFFSQNSFKLNSVREMIQVIDSIPWVRCASGNVCVYGHNICVEMIEIDRVENYMCPSTPSRVNAFHLQSLYKMEAMLMWRADCHACHPSDSLHSHCKGGWALLPRGSPFGDPGPHGDLFQFLDPQKVPIFFPRSPFSLFQAEYRAKSQSSHCLLNVDHLNTSDDKTS